METVVDNTLIQSGGGNYLIKVLPTWQLGRGLTEGNPIPDSGGNPLITTSSISANYERSWQEQSALKIFEYPFKTTVKFSKMRFFNEKASLFLMFFF